LRHHVHRRRIGVPKGLLRYLSLKLLQRQPMSGSEITEKIEEFTNWKPSPGSIYPLLANLQETDLIEPYTDADPGLKQFNITEKGKKEMEEMQRHPENIKARHISMRKLFWIMHRNIRKPQPIVGNYRCEPPTNSKIRPTETGTQTHPRHHS
jgi:DNA-binding PadR family transcriptional regulator